MADAKPKDLAELVDKNKGLVHDIQKVESDIAFLQQLLLAKPNV